MEILDYLDKNQLIKIPHDLLSIHRIRMINMDGSEIIYYASGGSHDIYNMYEMTSNVKKISVTSSDYSDVIYYEGISPRDTYYSFGHDDPDMVDSKLFQVIFKDSKEIYLSVHIPQTVKKCEFYDEQNHSLGEFTLDKVKGKDAEFYLRLSTEDTDSYDSKSFIYPSYFLDDKCVDFLNGSMIGRDLMSTSEMSGYFSKVHPMISGDYVPTHNLKLNLSEPEEVTVLKNTYKKSDADEKFHLGFEYSKGERVSMYGVTYESTIDNNLSIPIESSFWKLI